MSKIRRKRGAFSLLELLAVVTILGIIALVVIPRISVSSQTAEANADAQNKSELNGAIERFYFDTGAYPDDLDDLVTDYFPGGLPTVPGTDGTAYTMDEDTHRVN